MQAVEASVAGCAWCGAPLGADAVHRGRRTECRACGAATTDPWPSEAELDGAYGTWYRPDAGRFGPAGDALLRRSRGLVARRIDSVAPAGPILDVGAGDGALIDVLRRRGREAVGLEREARGEHIRGGSLEEMEGEWAAIVFWHSLEHLPDPRGAIREAVRLLSPGGIVVVAVPNTGSLQAERLGDRWLHLDPPLHLIHLSERALVARLEACGLRVEHVSHVRGGQIVIGWLDGLVGRLPGAPRLYQALRQPGAQSARIPAPQRVATIAAAVALFPAALALSVLEVARGRSGTVCVEARRA